MQLLVDALLNGDQGRSVAEAGRLRREGVALERIVAEGIGAAMGQLDSKCTIDQFNLLEIMLVGRAVNSVIKELFPQGTSAEPNRGTIVLASLEGDVHDLGKNITKMVLAGKGYRVIDCGKDCPLERLIDTAEQQQAEAIGISGLITTVISQIKKIKMVLEQRGLGHIKVFAGGAALKQATAEMLRVDFVAETAFDGGRFLGSAVK
ncbi:MAG: cobalamin B12-binding domain-containing protein [Deltaproteobacteria bacterium]|nr:cobalamin B12-binding domain-containing protein [Deltaproteobacteria bacterium]